MALLVSTAVAGCTHVYPPPGQSPAPVPCGGACSDSVGITYLGSGGFVIRHGRDALLTAPYFTAPYLLHSRHARVDTLVQAWVRDPGDVRAVLVGHSHYDHALDLPWLMHRWLPDTAVHVFGTRALAWTFAADRELRPRIRQVEAGAGTVTRPGKWYRAGGFRFMPLRSEHAPHLFGWLYVLPRRIARPLPYRPWSALSYPEGRTLAYLVDVTDGSGRVLFRVHWQDAASRPPIGFPPRQVTAEKPVDVAIICGAAFQQVHGYPQQLLRETRPRSVVVGHWEDFILRNPFTLRDVPNTGYRDLERRLAEVPGLESRWVPVPGQTRWFCVCPAGEDRPRPPLPRGRWPE